MGFWKYSSVGVSVPPAIMQRVKEVMYCLFPGGETGCSDESVQDDFVPDIMMTAENALVSSTQLYLLLKKLFGKVRVYEESGEGNSISDAYEHMESIYDPASKKRRCASYNYCSGDRTIYDLPAFRFIDQDKLRKMLENAGIRETIKDAMLAQDWVLDEEYDDVFCLMDSFGECENLRYCWSSTEARLFLEEELPDAADVIDQVVAMIDQLESDVCLSAAAIRTWDEKLPNGTVKSSVVENLRKAAEEKGYQELLVLIQKKWGS